MSVEVDEDGVFLYFEAVDFEERGIILISILKFLLHLGAHQIM
jgi:hypothetical protein